MSNGTGESAADEAAGENVSPNKLACPQGYYRRNYIVWHCNGDSGSDTFYLEPKERKHDNTIPKGVVNLKGSFQAQGDIDIELYDTATQQYVIRYSNGVINTENRNGFWQGVNITYSGDDTTSPAYESFDMVGVIPTPLDLRFHNYDNNRVKVEAQFSYNGITPCPENPTGCDVYMEDAAKHAVREWSCDVQLRYPTSEGAWAALGQPYVESGQAQVPWYNWVKVWRANRPDLEANSWQQGFHWLDQNSNVLISKEEFIRGYQLCSTHAPPPAADDSFDWIPWAIFGALLSFALCAALALILTGVGGGKKSKGYRSVPKLEPGNEDEVAKPESMPAEAQPLLEPDQKDAEAPAEEPQQSSPASAKEVEASHSVGRQTSQSQTSQSVGALAPPPLPTTGVLQLPPTTVVAPPVHTATVAAPISTMGVRQVWLPASTLETAPEVYTSSLQMAPTSFVSGGSYLVSPPVQTVASPLQAVTAGAYPVVSSTYRVASSPPRPESPVHERAVTSYTTPKVFANSSPTSVVATQTGGSMENLEGEASPGASHVGSRRGSGYLDAT